MLVKPHEAQTPGLKTMFLKSYLGGLKGILVHGLMRIHEHRRWHRPDCTNHSHTRCVSTT